MTAAQGMTMTRTSFLGAGVLLVAGAAHAETATVHVRSATSEVVVERWDSGTWQSVCRGTCDQPLDLEGTYRITGAGIRTTPPFHLDKRPIVDLAFERKPNGAFSTGLTLTITGASFLATGLGFGIATLAYFLSPHSGDNGGPLAVAALGGLIAGASTVVGLSTLIPGVVLMANNKSPRVSGDVPMHPEPIFRDARATMPMPTFMGVPLLSGRF
jgi:hypothetical protein